MLKIIPLKDDARQSFTNAFARYYAELSCEDNAVALVDDYIIPDLLAGLISVDVLFDGDELTGFVIYQTDDITNDFNFKEGFGDVREIYVLPPFRRQGYGKFLLYTAEMKLKEAGAEKCYTLPTPQSENFFTACGYERTDEYCAELDCNVYIKQNLNNCECKGK